MSMTFTDRHGVVVSRSTVASSSRCRVARPRWPGTRPSVVTGPSPASDPAASDRAASDMAPQSSLATVPDPDPPTAERRRWGQRLAAHLTARDPSLRATKRSVRAAVVVPAAFAIARAVSADANVQLFAAFGAVALLLFVD